MRSPGTAARVSWVDAVAVPLVRALVDALVDRSAELLRPAGAPEAIQYDTDLKQGPRLVRIWVPDPVARHLPREPSAKPSPCVLVLRSAKQLDFIEHACD
jgi:hypothetical protein